MVEKVEKVEDSKDREVELNDFNIELENEQKAVNQAGQAKGVKTEVYHRFGPPETGQKKTQNSPEKCSITEHEELGDTP